MRKNTLSASTLTILKNTHFQGSCIQEAAENASPGSMMTKGASDTSFIGLTDESKGQGDLLISITVGALVPGGRPQAKTRRKRKGVPSIESRSITVSCASSPSIKELADSLRYLANGFNDRVRFTSEEDRSHFANLATDEGEAKEIMKLLVNGQIFASLADDSGARSSYHLGLGLDQSDSAKQMRRFRRFYHQGETGFDVISTLSADRDGSVFLGMRSTYGTAENGCWTNDTSSSRPPEITFYVGVVLDGTELGDTVVTFSPDKASATEDEELIVPIKELVGTVLGGESQVSAVLLNDPRDRTLLERWNEDPLSALHSLKAINYKAGDERRTSSTFRNAYV